MAVMKIILQTKCGRGCCMGSEVRKPHGLDKASLLDIKIKAASIAAMPVLALVCSLHKPALWGS